MCWLRQCYKKKVMDKNHMNIRIKEFESLKAPLYASMCASNYVHTHEYAS